MNFATRIIAQGETTHWFENLGKEQQRKYLDRHPNSNFGSDGPSKKQKEKTKKLSKKPEDKSLDEPRDLTERVTTKKPSPKNSGILNQPEYLPEEDTELENSPKERNYTQPESDLNKELDDALDEDQDLSELEEDLSEEESGQVEDRHKDKPKETNKKDSLRKALKKSGPTKIPKPPKSSSYKGYNLSDIPEDKHTMKKVLDYIKDYKYNISKEEDPAKKEKLEEELDVLIHLHNQIFKSLSNKSKAEKDKKKKGLGRGLLDIGKRIFKH